MHSYIADPNISINHYFPFDIKIHTKILISFSPQFQSAPFGMLVYGTMDTINKYFIPFLLFDINKFMIEEHSLLVHSMPDLADPPKRKRTPSQYASQIDDFKNNHPSRKPKTIKFCPQTLPQHQDPSHNNSQPLLCKLLNNKTISLTIVINPLPSKNGKKPAKKAIKVSDPANSERVEAEKKAEANLCLLDKLLSAVQNLQREQENDSKQNNNKSSKENPEQRPDKKLDRFRRERQKDEKWSKNYERYLSLTSRLQTLEEQYIFLQ